MMKRVIKIEKKYNDNLNDLKYIFQQEYEGFGIYQEMCPSGYYKHQSYMITNGEVALLSFPFTNLCKEELLDIIDTYIEDKRCPSKFGIKGFHKGTQENLDIYVIHQNGNVEL